MPEFVTVVNVESLSFTGTTWINTILGSHENAFTLGPPQRAWEMTEGSDACRIHGKDCEFWPGFFDQWKKGEDNFFVSLSQYSGKNYIITNNPVPGQSAEELNDPRVLVKRIRLIRDGRALAASYARHYPEKGFHAGLSEFLNPAFSQFEFDPQNSEILSLRYEDILADKQSTLDRCGEFVGLDYEPKALRFWEWEHHASAGNHGLFALIKFGQGIDVQNFEGKEFYEQQFKRSLEDEGDKFQDQRWMSELSRGQLFLFDLCFGDDNARYGYDRDEFSVQEFRDYLADVRAGVGSGSLSPFVAERLASSGLGDLAPIPVHGGGVSISVAGTANATSLTFSQKLKGKARGAAALASRKLAAYPRLHGACRKAARTVLGPLLSR